MSQHLLISRLRAERILTRLAYEILERNRGSDSLVLVGIRKRGVGLANTIASSIASVEGKAIPVYPLDVTAFRDDLEDQQDIKAFDSAPAVVGKDVILIDDVLFTGRTARAAIDAILHHGRPSSIQLAVLIDRGHREFPVQPDYVGTRIPTKHRERVVVNLDSGVEVVLEDEH
jgi:pyrimidine operon attenuation protein / uracil phosphoribosyltransferase